MYINIINNLSYDDNFLYLKKIIKINKFKVKFKVIFFYIHKNILHLIYKYLRSQHPRWN